MNRKLVLGGAAGIAAIALAVGGTTYSAWSDFGSINDNNVGASMLKLDLSNRDGSGVVPMNFHKFAPAGLTAGHDPAAAGQTQNVWIASSSAESAPVGDLTVAVSNLKDQEDGCTTNSEAVAEGKNPSSAGYDAATACGGANQGELSQQLGLNVVAWRAADAATCHTNAAADGATSHQVYIGSLNNMNDPSYAVGPLAPGQGMCLSISAVLPPTATNAVQGDSSTFDLDFTLTQQTA